MLGAGAGAAAATRAKRHRPNQVLAVAARSMRHTVTMLAVAGGSVTRRPALLTTDLCRPPRLAAFASGRRTRVLDLAVDTIRLLVVQVKQMRYCSFIRMLCCPSHLSGCYEFH